MAAASTAADSKPKRKRQRKRKAVSSSDSDSSSSSSDDSSSEDEAPAPPPRAPTPSEEEESSSSDSSSSDSDSEPELRGRRRGRKVAAKQAAAAQAAAAPAGSTTYTRPYPARSPSPEGLVPNNIPLGQGVFPGLKALPKEGGILAGLRTGAAAEGAGVEGTEEERAREAEFGEWWRARLVSEFEKDLAPLAAEPALTAPRLALLLSSLTSLSSLHTTSSSSAAAAKSIWHHDPATAIDPLAALEVDETGEAWGKAAVGGAGDVEAGAEGVALKRSILLRNRMMDVRRNQRELMTDSNRTSDSFILFCPFSSRSTWSYSLSATQKMIEVTASKQWIHFLRSLRCPPTSNMWIESCPDLNFVSLIPVVFVLACRTSASFGM